MISAPGTPDVLSLATFAYQVYDTYKGAPKRFKSLCDDIGGLELVLKALGNRLILLQGSSKSLLEGSNAFELQRLVTRTGNLLQELQEKQGSAHAPRGLSRFKWSQTEVDSTRGKITAICATIAAYNSSIVPSEIISATSNGAQLQILDRLDQFFISFEQNSRSKSATLITSEMTVRPVEESALWQELVEEMKHHGISEAEASRYRSMILKWATRANAAGLIQDSSSLPSYTDTVSQHNDEEVEVLSAVYGPANVTGTMQRLFNAHARQSVSKISFSVTNDTFGEDPFFGSVKSFCMVWRKAIRLEYGTLYSAPQKVFAKEDDTIFIDLNNPLPGHKSSDGKPGSIHILAANWHNKDVTAHVAEICRASPQPSIEASVYEFESDPQFGYVKNFSVTWAYSDAAPTLSYCEVLTAREGQTLEIPPFLDIKCANFGGMDITSTLRAKIGLRQTLSIDTNNLNRISSKDPWPGVQKTLLVLYQYGTSPMQLLVTHEGEGIVTIHPKSPFRNNFFFSSKAGPASNISIMGVVWGLRPVAEDRFLRKALQTNEFLCTNAFFDRDGWGGREKTCQVLLQNTLTDEIICVSAKEDKILKLPTEWPEEEKS